RQGRAAQFPHRPHVANDRRRGHAAEPRPHPGHGDPRRHRQEDVDGGAEAVGRSDRRLVRPPCGTVRKLALFSSVIPAKAGIQGNPRGWSMWPWIPACAGITTKNDLAQSLACKTAVTASAL